MTNDQFMPRWAYVFLATLAATIGLAASVITAKFFVLGLERLEPDNIARDVLIATGVLMILTELLAFGLAALLPATQLKALRTKLIICGTLLLTFEVATIYITQVALMQNATASATATDTRITGLQKSIESRRAAAQGLRTNGESQSASTNAWTRTLGAKALRDALQAEQQIDPLNAELAQLQAQVRPNLATVIGETGVLIYSVTRAFLISAMGLVMFAAAGALLRESRPKTVATATATEATAQTQANSTAAIVTEQTPADPTAAPAHHPKKRSYQIAGLSLASLVFTPLVAATVNTAFQAQKTTDHTAPVPAATTPAETAPAPSTSTRAAAATAPGAAPHPTRIIQKIQLSPAQAKKGWVSKKSKIPAKGKVLPQKTNKN